ncbi:sialidase family protein [Microlunatus soli]|uniref:BNR repeat-like domain-containing protein n=1 Tax=Microlunatus soli TaxID=630515 RepID=A0A1H1XF27_9ACTN|nr:sialidase family protein [Microlunatus soli]SDT07329.1 BNR repeat-like domain-containing protein [Microlunatus soli]
MRRRTLITFAPAVGLLPLALTATPATAEPGRPRTTTGDTIRTFDDEPVGAAPADATVRGDVTVAEAPFGATGNRAVRLRGSAAADSAVIFEHPAAPARRFAVDLAPHQVQPFRIAIHGSTADGQDAVGYRLTVGPLYNYGRSATAQVSISGPEGTRQLGAIPDLTDQDQPTRIELTATAQAIVLTVGEFVFRSTDRIETIDSITGIEFLAAATGTDLYLDDLASTDRVSSEATDNAVAATDVITSLTTGAPPSATPAARIRQPGVTAEDVTARVHVGGRWRDAVISGRPGRLTVSAALQETDIGLQPVTVTITERATGLSRSAQARTQSYPPIPTAVVAQESDPARQARFPDAVRLADGKIIAVYHSATGHTQANGVIRLVSSTDEGRTWTEPKTVVAGSYDNRDPKITQLRDGTLLLSIFRTDWSTGGANVGTFVLRSTDGGVTFPTEAKIESSKPGTYEHGPAVELADGDILQPLYGSGARIARSSDGGRTFAAADEVTAIADTAANYNREPNLVLLPTGELIMVIRTYYAAVGAERMSRIVRSTDGGRTWSAPEVTDLPTSSHHLLPTEDGSVLITFGNILQAQRPTYAALITDPSGPWTGYRQIGVFNAGPTEDQANPSSVSLADGSYLSFGQRVTDRSIVCWRTRTRDYS